LQFKNVGLLRSKNVGDKTYFFILISAILQLIFSFNPYTYKVINILFNSLSMKHPIIEIQNLSQKFGNFTAVKDTDKTNEAPETAESEAAESARLAPLAKISASQAEATALANHSGNINNVILEDEDGTIVYGLEYANGDEVKIDATTGVVVKVEMAGEEDAD